MNRPDRPRWVAVGRITRAHGVHGEVAVMPLTEVAERFDPGSRVVLDDDPARVLEVDAVRPHRDRLLVTFHGVEDRTAAERLAGRYVFVGAEESPELPEDAFWPHQLVGAEVLTDTGDRLGTLAEVVHTDANDIWVARAEDGSETLVPALKDVVVAVDTAAGRVVVREIPGLTVPEAR